MLGESFRMKSTHGKGSSFPMERLAVNWPIGKVLNSPARERLQALGKPEVAPYINRLIG